MTGSREPLVLTRREGPILVVTLNRPEKLNALHPDLVGELSVALADAEGASDTGVLIITGAGRAFSAGLDLELLLRWNHQEKIEYLSSVIRIFHRIWEMPQPVIAAVNGAAIAGGFDLAAFCDIRLASRNAIFGQAEINLGLVQVIHPLYKSIGLARAKELAMTGDSISAEEAYRIGLVNHVYDPEDLIPMSIELARKLAAKPRTALFETKRLTRELISMDVDAALNEISGTLKRCLELEEHADRVREVYSKMKRAGSEIESQKSLRSKIPEARSRQRTRRL
jgi:enoyl-CoA hydratase